MERRAGAGGVTRRGAAAALAGVLATIVAAQAIGGRWPAFYGVLLGVSLFIAGAMATMGVLAFVLRLAADPDR